MTPLEKRDGFGSFLRDAIGAAENGSFDHDKMRDEFRSRPCIRKRLCGPLVRGDGIGGAKEGALGFCELLLNTVERLHLRLLYHEWKQGGTAVFGALGKASRKKYSNEEGNFRE